MFLACARVGSTGHAHGAGPNSPVCCWSLSLSVAVCSVLNVCKLPLSSHCAQGIMGDQHIVVVLAADKPVSGNLKCQLTQCSVM